MTDPLFLDSVTLENYRSFGKLTLPFAPGPSVLVVAGPNGLGKTSLIEGIEWALTGRLRRYPGRQKEAVDALQRRVDGAVAEPLSVTLAFNEKTTIRRLLHDHLEINGDVGDWLFQSSEDAAARVGGFLKADDWAHAIHDLSAYLGLTHFLSQSPALRLTARTGEQRWDDLSGLTGAKRIDKIIANLAPSKRGQVTKRMNALSEKLGGLKDRREALRDLLRQVKEQEALLRAGEAMAPEQVLKEVGALLQYLQKFAGLYLEVAPSDSAVEALAALRDSLRGAEAQIHKWLEVLETANPLPGKWQALGRRCEQLKDDLTTVQACEGLRAKAEDIATNVQRLEKRQTLLSRLPALRQDVDADIDGYHQVVKVLQVAQATHDRLAGGYRQYVALCEEVRTAESISLGWHALVAQELLVRERLAAIQGEGPERQKAQQGHDAALEQARQADEDLRKTDAALAATEKEAAEIAAAISEKLGHLQSLLALLREEEAECPLCLTHHPKDPGWVLVKAREALERRDPALKEVNARLAEARRARDEAQQWLTKRQAAAADTARALQQFQQREAEAAEAVDTLCNDPRVGGRPLEGLAEWLAGKLTDAERSLADARKALDAVDPQGDLVDQLKRASDELRLKEQEKSASETRLSGLRAAVEECEAEIEENGRIVGDLDLAETAQALAKVRREHQRASLQRDAAFAALRLDLRSAMENTPLPSMAADLAEKYGEATDARTSVQKAWRSHNLQGDPDHTVLAEQRNRGMGGMIMITHAIDSVGRLHDGLTAWHQDSRLKELKRRIAGLVEDNDAKDSDSLLTILNDEIAKTTAQLEKWRRASTLMGQVCEIVEREQDTFFTEIIRPLQKQVSIIDRAWSPFPDLQAELQPSRVRSKTHLNVQAGGIDAEFRLSEGQAGAKALSFLLAASTAYPWSRWKALLLDDPFQYNDLVHKAGFLDMLRPLIREQRYQVVMSTHDLEEAHFIGRKCENAGIAFTLCRLVSLERGGVKVELR